MYKTIEEMHHFQFEEAYIDSVGMNLDTFVMDLENVKILPENSCNRDIRLMRTNDMTFQIVKASISLICQEGFRRYDADGKLLETVNDEEIPIDQYSSLLKELDGCTLFSIEKNSGLYDICIDGPEHIYHILLKGESDIQKWERFINV